MKNIDIELTEHAGKEMKLLTFKELIEKICGVPFEMVYPDLKGEENVKEGELE